MKQLFLVSVLALVTSTTPIWANSCSNIDIMGTYDRSGIEEYGDTINARVHFVLKRRKMRASNHISISLQ
jgi:hypothetical protein